MLTGEQLPEAIPVAELHKIQALPGIRAVPYLNQRTAFRNRPIPVIGIWPAEMREVQRWQVAAGRYFASADEPGVIVGSAIAQQFSLQPGDTFTVRGEPIPVLGVLQATGTKDDIATFVPLTIAQRIYAAEGKVSFITVQVADLDRLQETSLEIERVANVAVVSDKQLVSSVLSIVGTVGAAMQAIAAVGVVAAAFGIINTLLTAVYERRREIGIIQAIGGSWRTVFFSFILESALYGVLGGLLGIALGALAALWLGPYFADNPFTASLRQTAGPAFDAFTIAYVLSFSVALSLLAGLYPAWRAGRLSPMEAMRNV